MQVVYGDKFAHSVSDYTQVLHNFAFENNSKSNTLLINFNSCYSKIIDKYDHVIMFDWFGVDDPGIYNPKQNNEWNEGKNQREMQRRLDAIDKHNVTFVTTNMQCKMSNAQVLHYNFMRNRSKLMYTETFPIVRNSTRYHLLLTDDSGKSYKKIQYTTKRNKDFLFLNARRQTSQRTDVQKTLTGLNGYISTPDNKFLNDSIQPYGPPDGVYFSDSYYHIVVETNIYGNVVHTTEKIWEPIIKYQIPIVLATSGYQDYMESLGFVFPIDVFTDVEKYCDFLTKFFAKDCKQFFLDNQQAVLHNNKLFFELPLDQTVKELLTWPHMA